MSRRGARTCRAETLSGLILDSSEMQWRSSPGRPSPSFAPSALIIAAEESIEPTRLRDGHPNKDLFVLLFLFGHLVPQRLFKVWRVFHSCSGRSEDLSLSPLYHQAERDRTMNTNDRCHSGPSTPTTTTVTRYLAVSRCSWVRAPARP